MTDNCGNCKYFYTVSKTPILTTGPKQGACRLNPPVPMIIPTGRGNADLQGVYSPVTSDCYCGQHDRALPDGDTLTKPHQGAQSALEGFVREREDLAK